jgi:transcriptional regulator with XRE-family HTH domain
MSVDLIIAKRVRELRKARGHALDTLAELSGVSRSMISLIERGETSPTAAVLNKLADAFGVTLATLFSEEVGSAPAPLSRLAEQHVWKDPASGYVRRHVSPSGYASPIELVEVLFPPVGTVTFENIVRNVVTHQQVWVLEGEMIVTVDDEPSHLYAGDCLAMVLGQRIAFHNPTSKHARYAVVLTTIPGNPRRQG